MWYLQSVLLPRVPIAYVNAWGSLPLACHVPCSILPTLETDSLGMAVFHVQPSAIFTPSCWCLRLACPVVQQLTPPWVHFLVAQEGWRERPAKRMLDALQPQMRWWSLPLSLKCLWFLCQHLSHSKNSAYRVSDLVSYPSPLAFAVVDWWVFVLWQCVG